MDTPDLTEVFDSLAKRPQMHIGPASFASMRAYLRGIRTGLLIAGVPSYSLEDQEAAAASRGWDCRGSEGIVQDFRRKKLTDEQMMKELVAVEEEAYRLGAVRRDRVNSK